MPSVSITRSLTLTGSDWVLAAQVTDSLNAAQHVFIVEKQRLVGVFEEDTTKYLRVATEVELGTLAKTTGQAAITVDGYHVFRTNTISQKFRNWNEAKDAYDAMTAGINSLVIPDDTTEASPGSLKVGVSGLVPYRDASVAYSVYPLDVVYLKGVEGAGDYVFDIPAEFSLAAGIYTHDPSGSTLDAATGKFIAGVPPGVDLTDLVRARVTDADSATAEINATDAAITIVRPTALNVTETISNG